MSDRLFFALWPDDAIRDEVARRLPQWTEGLVGRVRRPDQWHVTLEFLGAIALQRQAVLREIAQHLPLPACALGFDRLEHWSRPQVACLVATQVPAPLATFVERLRAGLAQAGFTPEARPFRPHVTLARKVTAMHDAAVVPPLHWPASSVALVRSIVDPAGSRYEPIACWNGAVRSG